MHHQVRLFTLLSLTMLMTLIGCQAAATPLSAVRPDSTEISQPTATLLPTATPNPFPNPILKIVGKEEVVYDWAKDHCQPLNIPDLPTRAFHDASGMVQLILSHFIGYRMVGPDLNHLKVDCHPIMSSQHSADPALYSDAEWIAAPYTEDGTTIYAIIHDEYQGNTHPGQCPQKEYLPCWYNALSLVVSKDGGKSYAHITTPPGQLVASVPDQYAAGSGPYGMMSPSNIIKGKDGYYYEFVKYVDGLKSTQWDCLMRTQDLSDPKSWRFWNGTSFDGRFANPYADQISNPSDYRCPAIAPTDIAGPLVESLTYNTYLDRYVLVGISAYTSTAGPVWGFYYSFSNDLIHWTQRKLLAEMPLPWTVKNSGTDLSYLYPALLDQNSESRNFETTGKTAYLYYTRHNHGQGSLDRDLIRVPVEFFPTDGGIAWEFESNGNTEGWSAWNQLSPLQVSDGHLITQSTGDDPYMHSSFFSVDANLSPIININMKVNSGNWAQLFFITDTDGAYNESKSLRFMIQPDGEFHTYTLDMSKVQGWDGLITQIRLDPVETPASVEVDYIRITGR